MDVEVVPMTAEEAESPVVAIAASAGGLAALTAVLSNLPSTFPAALVIVQHLDPSHRSMMSEILTKRTLLAVKQAAQGDVLRRGIVYVAPPDQHLLVNPDHSVSLSHTELVHFVRPSADLMFESVAGSYGPRAIAVVLTGTGRDGATGACAIKERGGTVLAQDEETSQFFGMPGAAIESGCVDQVLPLSAIAPALVSLMGERTAIDAGR